jgi:protein TonB
VTVKFVVHKDGRITDIAVAAKCPIGAFNDSSRKAIASSNPTTPLPSEYAPEKAAFRMTFYYNESPPTPISGGVVGSLAGAPPQPTPPPRAPTKIKDVAPVYPDVARSAGVEGSVVFTATIGRDGKVVDVAVRKSIPLLDQAARDAVLQWEFTPMTIDGVPVPFVMTLTVNFRLK